MDSGTLEAVQRIQHQLVASGTLEAVQRMQRQLVASGTLEAVERMQRRLVDSATLEALRRTSERISLLPVDSILTAIRALPPPDKLFANLDGIGPNLELLSDIAVEERVAWLDDAVETMLTQDQRATTARVDRGQALRLAVLIFAVMWGSFTLTSDLTTAGPRAANDQAWQVFVVLYCVAHWALRQNQGGQ